MTNINGKMTFIKLCTSKTVKYLGIYSYLTKMFKTHTVKKTKASLRDIN